MKLSIIIPIYNEEKTLLKVLDKIEKVDLEDVKKEIILVDDFSTDSTRDILKKLESKYKVIYHKNNQGKGKSIRTGLSFATGNILIIQDADLEYNPEDYVRLIKPILERKTKVVYGSRFWKERPYSSICNFFGNKFLSFLTSILYFRKITDMETCYKVFTKEVIQNISLKAKRFEFEPEITAKICKKGYKILEIPVEYSPRKISEGKKINWKDGVEAAYYLVKYRFFN